MLVFDEFIDELSNVLLNEYLDDGYSIYKRDVVKNNQTGYKALQIVKDGDNISPSIYMEAFYDMYVDGKDIKEIAVDVLDYYNEHADGLSVDVDELSDYEKMSQKVIIRLINYEKNKESQFDPKIADIFLKIIKSGRADAE